MSQPHDKNLALDLGESLNAVIERAVTKAVTQAVEQAMAEALPEVLGQAKGDPVLVMDVRDAATRLGLSESKVHRLIVAGEIASISIGRRRKIPGEAINAYLRRLSGEQPRLPGM